MSSSLSQFPSLWQRAPFNILLGQLGGGIWSASRWTDELTRYWSGSLSPYQRILIRQRSRCSWWPPASAHGKAEVFSGKRLTAGAVMASACLPMVFRAVEIEGNHFWDVGHTGNLTLHPLIYQCKSRDIMLVQINPIRRDKLPTQPGEIADLVNEINFNSGLVAEMRAIDFVKRLLAEGKLNTAQYKDVLMHRIDGGEALETYSASTKASADAGLIHSIRDLGGLCARRLPEERLPGAAMRSTDALP